MAVVFISFCTLYCTSNRCIIFMLHLTMFLSDRPCQNKYIQLTFSYCILFLKMEMPPFLWTISGLFRLFPIFYCKQRYRDLSLRASLGPCATVLSGRAWEGKILITCCQMPCRPHAQPTLHQQPRRVLIPPAPVLH